MTFPAEETITTLSDDLPYNKEAEEAAIGAVMIDPSAFHEIRVHIESPEEFYVHKHRMVWKAYEELQKNKMQIDIITVADQLNKQGDLQDVGGDAYITGLIGRVAASFNAADYARIVHENSVRRKMIEAANSIATLAYKGDSPLDEITSKATHSLSTAISAAATQNVFTISQSLSLVYDKIEERAQSKILPGIPTGLIDLDRLMGGGAQDSDLLLIVGRPGQGKTSLLMQIARYGALYRVEGRQFEKRVVIFSLEMPQEQLTLRLISQLSGIDFQVLRSGKIPDNKQDAFIKAIDDLSQLDIVIDDRPGVSGAYIRSRVEMLSAEKKVDMVLVDSLNLMRSGLKFGERRDAETDHNARELKLLAREGNIPVWASQQMNRGIEHRGDNARPKLADLQEGGEKDADFVLFVHSTFEDDKKKIKSTELISEKHRNGPTGSIDVVFNSAFTRFENAAKVNPNY